MVAKRFALLFFVFTLLSTACQGEDTRIHIKFKDAQGLVTRDRVISQGQKIGEVAQVKYTSYGDFLVDVVVPERFRDRLTDRSRFYLIDDPDREGKKAVEVVQQGAPGKPLDDGATVVGSSKIDDMINELMAEMHKGLGQLEAQYQELLDSLKKLPESEEVKRLQEEFQKLLENMKKEGKAAREKFKKEILPKLEKELDRLKEKLKELGREKEVEPLEINLEELKKI
ncbi:MAG: hypothetical protein DRH12_05895 [Deltaproteobacteria bacterium]|nr:MAG: hypothetical protein DRH12_05895 [Deltaproteobacteria bacterium]